MTEKDFFLLPTWMNASMHLTDIHPRFIFDPFAVVVRGRI